MSKLGFPTWPGRLLIMPGACIDSEQHYKQKWMLNDCSLNGCFLYLTKHFPLYEMQAHEATLIRYQTNMIRRCDWFSEIKFFVVFINYDSLLFFNVATAIHKACYLQTPPRPTVPFEFQLLLFQFLFPWRLICHLLLLLVF